MAFGIRGILVLDENHVASRMGNGSLGMESLGSGLSLDP